MYTKTSAEVQGSPMEVLGFEPEGSGPLRAAGPPLEAPG